jgi:hypothetical protein
VQTVAARAARLRSTFGITGCLMKKTLVILNVIAAVALVFLGSLAVAAHRTHAYSVYVELKQQNVLLERPDYDIERRLRTIAAGGTYSSSIAMLGAAACLVNALAIGFVWRAPKA